MTILVGLISCALVLAASPVKRFNRAYEKNRWEHIIEMADKDTSVLDNSPKIALMVAEANYYLFNISEARDLYDRVYESGYYDWQQVYIDHYYSTLMYDGQYETILASSKKFSSESVKYPGIDTKVANAKWALDMIEIDSMLKRTVITDTLNITRNQTLGVGKHGDTLLFTVKMQELELSQLSNIVSEATDVVSERVKETSFVSYALGDSGKSYEIEGTQHITGISGAPVFSPDNEVIVFTRYKLNRVGTDLYEAHKKDNKWVGIRRIDFGRRNESFAMPAFTPDGEWLYFASNKKGSVGQWDIYRSKVSEYGFEKPENLGDKVNTPFDEIFPYVDNTNTLFFASDGHRGYGNLDLFSYSLTGSDTVARNLLAPYNTGLDDYVVIVEQGDTTAQGFLGRGLGDQQQSVLMSFISTDELLLDEEDIAELIKTGKKPDVKVEPEPVMFDKLVEKTLLAADTRGVDMRILFAFDIDSISDEYKTHLTKIAEYLKHNEELHIMVFGHTDPYGSEAYNQVLSHKRAWNAKRYLIESCGFEPEMLLTVAAGEYYGIYKNEKRQPFKMQRRVTLGVVKERINYDGSLVAILQKEQISVEDMCDRFNMDEWDLRQLNGLNHGIIEANSIVFIRLRKVAYGWQYDKLAGFDMQEEYPMGTMGRVNNMEKNSVLTEPVRLYFPLIRK